jgi:RecB family exonuclease
MSRILFESSSAEDRIERAVRWLAEREEAHVTVVGGTLDAAAEVCRRAVMLRGKGSLGWSRTTLSGLAASLARTELARLGLAPASPLALEAICARVVHDAESKLGRFAPIADRPGLPRALSRTIGELRLARLDSMKDEHLARLLAVYEKELASAQLADRAQTLAIAAKLALREGAICFIDVPLEHAAERDLVAALATSELLVVVPTGDDRALDLYREALGKKVSVETSTSDRPLARVQRGLFATGEIKDLKDLAPHSLPQDAVTVLSAPGENRECVEIARIILAEAQRGTPLDRMAVLLRAPQYGGHVQEAFRRAKIPAFFARGTKRPDPSGRAFLALLACAAEGLSASRFAEYLSLGEVPDDVNGAPPPAAPRAERVAVGDDDVLRAMVGAGAALEPPPPSAPPSIAEEDKAVAAGTLRAPRHWERLLVEASVIGSADRWRSRLAGLAQKLEADVAAYRRKNEENLAEGSARELAALEALRRFALPLIDDLDVLPQEQPWGKWINDLGALATRALRHPDRVLAVLSELEPMAKVAKIGIREVRLVLESRLSQLLVPETGRRYGKVFVATTDEARGLSFDVVFVPGLAEKIFPQKVVEDPLLLDEARRRLSSGTLMTNQERTDKERLALRLAIGAATRRVVLSYPRVDVEQARPRTPSFYGLEVLRVAEGRLGDFEHLAKRAALTADARIGWPAPRKREDAIDEAEYDLALLQDVLEKPESEVNGEGNYLVGEGSNPHLTRALRFRYMRWDSQKMTRADGLVSPQGVALDAIKHHGLAKRSFSPTALQNFAACPYRFLLSAVHKLAPREETAAIEDMDPLTRGSLTHDVLYRLLTELAEQKMLPIKTASLDAVRARLETVLAEIAEEYRDRLSPAIARVWDDAIASIGADLREQVRRMAEETAWTPAHFELSFGLKDRRAQDSRSTDEPVTIEGGLQLRGSIDLVERSNSGTLRAMDYKTGKVRATEETVIGGGETLQPVLYALTLEKLFPGTRVEEGVLYYCTSTGDFTQVPVRLDDHARGAAKVLAKTIGDALEMGSLPAAPKIEKKGSACTWCDFKPICGPYEEIRTKKKPAVGPLKALAQLRKIK